MISAEKILTVDDQKMSVQELLGTNMEKEEQSKEDATQPEKPIDYTAKKSAPSVGSLIAGAQLKEFGQGVDLARIQHNLDKVEAPTTVKPVVVTADDVASGEKTSEEKKRIVWNAKGDQVDATTVSSDQASTTDGPADALDDLPMD